MVGLRRNSCGMVMPRLSLVSSASESFFRFKAKGLLNSLDHALRLSAENLKRLVSFKPIEDRLRQLDAEHTKMVEMANALEVHRFDQHLAELAVDITSARKVLEAIKVE